MMSDAKRNNIFFLDPPEEYGFITHYLFWTFLGYTNIHELHMGRDKEIIYRANLKKTYTIDREALEQYTADATPEKVIADATEAAKNFTRSKYMREKKKIASLLSIVDVGYFFDDPVGMKAYAVYRKSGREEFLKSGKVDLIHAFEKMEKRYQDFLTQVPNFLEWIFGDNESTASTFISRVTLGKQFQALKLMQNRAMDNIDVVKEAQPGENFPPLISPLSKYMNQLREIAHVRAAHFYDIDKKPLDTVQTAPLEKIYWPTDKVSDAIFTGKLTPVAPKMTLADNLTEIDVTHKDRSRKKKKPVLVYAGYQFSEDVDAPLLGFDAYDRLILNTIGTFWKSGVRDIPLKALYRAITQSTPTSAVSDQKVKELLTRIRRLVKNTVIVDYTDEAKRYYKDVDSNYRERNMLYGEIDYKMVKGQRAITLCLLSEKPPLLLEYAEQKGHVSVFPAGMLKTSLNQNADVMMLKSYLLGRLKQIQRMKCKKTSILHETIIKNVVRATATADKKRTLLKDAAVLLQEYKDRGEIKNFENDKKNKKFIIAV